MGYLRNLWSLPLGWHVSCCLWWYITSTFQPWLSWKIDLVPYEAVWIIFRFWERVLEAEPSICSRMRPLKAPTTIDSIQRGRKTHTKRWETHWSQCWHIWCICPQFECYFMWFFVEFFKLVLFPSIFLWKYHLWHIFAWYIVDFFFFFFFFYGCSM